MDSQWSVKRSSSVVVILGSVKTWRHSAESRSVVTITELRPNSLVLVCYKQGFPLAELFTPVWVTGRLSIDRSDK